MTNSITSTPRVAMPRSDARVTATPRTEQEYARLLNALCRKEGKRGKVPDNDFKGRARVRQNRDYTPYIKALRKGFVTVNSLADHFGYHKETVRYALDTLRNRDMVQYDKSKRQWEIVQ